MNERMILAKPLGSSSQMKKLSCPTAPKTNISTRPVYEQ